MIARPGGRLGSGVLLLAILLLMGYLALGLVYWQQQSQQRQLREELAQISPVALRPRAGLGGLTTQVQQAGALIPREMSETEVYPAIRDLAAQSGVVVRSQTQGKETSAKIGETSYRVFTFTLEVGGERLTYQRLRDFIANLETQERLPTLFVDKASITAAQDAASAVLDFRLYARAPPEARPTPPAKATPKPRR